VLVILDGASEPLGDGPTSLERAHTPALDALASEGELTRVRTVAPWLEAGSESAIPALLGWVPPAPVDRGLIEAAARELPLAPGTRAWRVDVRDAATGARADAATVRAALAAALPAYEVHAIGGHRLLVTGDGPLPSLLAALRFRFADLAPGPQPGGISSGPPALLFSTGLVLDPRPGSLALHLWPEGIVPPPVLDDSTVLVAARGAAAGIARLMRARVVIPPGTTGRPGSDFSAKAQAADDALSAGATQVVVHVGGADEAAHELDAAAKVAVLEQADRELIAPLLAAIRAEGGTLSVCPDHGCDPRTGKHDEAPVPRVDWEPHMSGTNERSRLTERGTNERGRLTERAVAHLPVTELATRELAAA
jgi:2,3-bisphosphoglycerate-independent phosphoglycerate mutase